MLETQRLVPYWVWQRRRPKMLVTDLLRKVVVFVGHNGIHGDEDFIADGTGFVLLYLVHGFAFPYIVTAKHVVDQASGKEGKNDVLLRFNKTGGGIEYIKTKLSEWQAHPDHVEDGRKKNYIDVAVLGLLNYKTWGRRDIFEKLDFVHLDEEDFCTDEIIEKYSIGVGDEVAIPGLFHSHMGVVQNVPILRTGNIAATRGEPVPTSRGPMDAYLVEMRSVGGISGSPVLTNMAVRPKILLPESPTAMRIEQSNKTHYLLGLIHGHYTITTQDEWVSKTDLQVGDVNAGIAVVVPISKIAETINGSALFAEDYEMARKFQELRNSQVKTVEDSAPSDASVPLSTDANPKHREDFNSLLGAAVQKPVQED